MEDFIPGRNGGRLLPGGKPGNRGGYGIPSKVRKLCAKGFAEAAPEIIKIAKGGEKVSATEQTNAFDKLGKYGIGELQAVSVENVEVLRAAVRIAAEIYGDEKIQEFADRLMAECEGLIDDTDDTGEGDSLSGHRASDGEDA